MVTNDSEVFACYPAARDGNHVIRALQQRGALGEFFTDFSIPGALGPLLRACGMSDRRVASIPFHLIAQDPGIFLGQRRIRGTELEKYAAFAELDAAFSRKALARWLKHPRHLFTYEPYALPLFQHPATREWNRSLFYFHPNRRLERELLLADADVSGLKAPPGLKAEDNFALDEAWRASTRCLFASTFSRNSILPADAKIPAKVVPYGVNCDESPVLPWEERARAFVYVGSGTQRKGLHHLLLGWKAFHQANPRYTLIIVCRSLDENMEPFLAQAEDVRIENHASDEEVRSIVRQSRALIMTSLYEGFGHVYLEALSCGTPILGSVNSGAPDLGVESDGVYIAPPGNINAISEMLHLIVARGEDGSVDCNAIKRRIAARFSWSIFEKEISDFILCEESAGSLDRFRGEGRRPPVT